MRPLATPLLVGLLAFAAIGAPTRPTATKSDNRLRPSIETLIRDACSDSAATRRAAFDELQVRWNADELDASTRQALIDGALTRQQSDNCEWDRGWGELIARARKDGLLDDERWQRYLRQAVRVSLRVRQNVRVADHVPYEVAYECRLGEGSVKAKVNTRHAFGARAKLTLNRDDRWISPGQGTLSGNAYPQNQRGTGLNVGPHPLHVVVGVQLFENVCDKPVGEYWLPLEQTCNIIPRTDGDADR